MKLPDANNHRPEAAYVLRLIRRTGMTRDAIADRLGVHRNTLVNWIATGKIDYPAQYSLEILADQVAPE